MPNCHLTKVRPEIAPLLAPLLDPEEFLFMDGLQMFLQHHQISRQRFSMKKYRNDRKKSNIISF
jgi:hypothetical protein